jgi:ribosomal protein S27E
MYKGLNVRAELVNGTCPTCSAETILISLTPELFRCVTCGTDLRQHVNGKISYIPHVHDAKDIKLEINRDG